MTDPYAGLVIVGLILAGIALAAFINHLLKKRGE